MLRSSNPILSKQDSFTPGRQSYDQFQANQPPFGYAPSQQVPGQPIPGQPIPGGYQPDTGAEPRGVMTLDDVITKTGIMLGIVILTAALTWLFAPSTLSFPLMIVAALGTIAITFIVAARRLVPVPLALVFAALEGVFVGLISRSFESYYDGIVVQALVATLVTAMAALAVYKFGGVRIRGMAAKVVLIGTIGFAVAMLLNFGLSFAGINLGLRAGMTGPVSGLAIAVSVVAVILAALNLVMDFDHVERGIEMRAPANESWRAAFGLTVTLVWLYVEILRIVSYFRR